MTTLIFNQQKIKIKRERENKQHEYQHEKRACANSIVSFLIELTKMVIYDEIKWKSDK